MVIVMILKYALVLMILVVGLTGVAFLFSADTETGSAGIKTRLRRHLKAMSARLPLAIVCIVLYLLTFLGMKLIQDQTEARVLIGLNYPQASRGLNPNKTRFNTFDMIDDGIMESVLAESGYSGITPGELRESFSVSPVEAGETLTPERYYVSTEYLLNYRMTKQTAGLDPYEAVTIAANAYYERFLDSFRRRTDVLEPDFQAVDEADYLDKIQILGTQAANIQEYMNTLSMEAPSFRSGENGENFSSIAGKAEDYKNVELERLKAYVLSTGVSEEKESYISKLNYLNRMKNTTYMKNLAAHAVRLEAIERYDRDMATVVLIPTRDEKGEFYMGRTKIGVDNFADEADFYVKNATRLQAEIETNNLSISKLLYSQAGEQETRSVDGMITILKNELADLAVSAKTLVEEYEVEKSKGYLVITPESRAWKDRYSLKRAALLTAAFAAAVLLLASAVPTEGRRRKNETI